MAKRIQRSRAKGWRMPVGVIYAGRGSILGNPFVIGQPSGVFPEGMGFRGQAETLIPALTLDQAMQFYRNVIDGYLTPEMYPHGHLWVERFRLRMHCSPCEWVRHALRGKDLACWCPLTAPCHVDILLELANHQEGAGG